MATGRIRSASSPNAVESPPVVRRWAREADGADHKDAHHGAEQQAADEAWVEGMPVEVVGAGQGLEGHFRV